jgi:hypothetical protein
MGDLMAGQSSGAGSPTQGSTGPARERERTAERPKDGKELAKRDDENGTPPDGTQPDSPRGTKDPGENRQGPPPRKDPTDPAARGNDADRWGDLPPRVQDVFRNQGRDDMPVQYREWIDNYYRRLNPPKSLPG